MKKKGFTLIELLAVIVILAIIAVIITPVISNIIESAREASSKSSAQGYIDAVKNRISLSILDHSSLEGTKTVSELESEVEYKGKRIDRGLVTVENDELREAKLCVNNYSFRYHNNSITKSDINYCVDESNIEVTILGTTTTELLKNQYSYDVDLSGTDISSATNIVCNNNAVPSLNGNTFHIDNIYGDTKCSIESSIKNTFDNLDDTTNNVVMVADENITNTLNIGENSSISLDLNGKILNKTTKSTTISNTGELILDDKVGTGKLMNSYEEDCGQGIVTRGGTTIINGGEIEIKGTCAAVYSGAASSNTGKVVINNVKINTAKTAIIVYSEDSDALTINGGVYNGGNNYLIRNNANGTIIINGGRFTAENGNTFGNLAGGVYIINQVNKPIYITTLAQEWKPAILNNSTGTINITASQANACTSNAEDTTSGLCIYAYANTSATNNDRNGTIGNKSTGTVNINGGTYYGGAQGINNNGNTGAGTINVRNAYIISDRGIVNTYDGVINICNVKFTTITNDIYNTSTGTINYSSDVVFNDGTNTPNLYNPSGTVNSNYTCQ